MKRKISLLFLAALWLLCPLIATAESGGENPESKPPLRAAIFIQNRAGRQLQSYLDAFNNQLTAGLTDRGFSIIDRNVVLAKFKESQEDDQDKQRERCVEDAVTGASALRVAQMIGADYLVIATLDSLSKETRTFSGEGTIYGTSNQSTLYNLRISLKVLDGNQGGSVYGDTVTASERKVVGMNLEITTTDIMPALIESGAKKIADNLSGRLERIRNVKIKSVPVVEFTLNSNVEGAVVELDGAAIGSTPGRFTAAPGLHQLKVSKEMLTPWERTVNIAQNQVLTVSLELSQEGLTRFATIEQLKVELAKARMNNDMELKERETGVKERETGIGIAKEQSEADAYAKKAISAGEQKRREESYERLEGPPPSTPSQIGFINPIGVLPVGSAGGTGAHR